MSDTVETDPSNTEKETGYGAILRNELGKICDGSGPLNPKGRGKLASWFRDLGPDFLLMIAAAGAGVFVDVPGMSKTQKRALKDMAEHAPRSLRIEAAKYASDKIHGRAPDRLELDGAIDVDVRVGKVVHEIVDALHTTAAAQPKIPPTKRPA